MLCLHAQPSSFLAWIYRDLKFITSYLNCKITLYDEIVTQIVMVLLETYLLSALICHISVPIRTIQHSGTARELNLHCTNQDSYQTT